jgi:hypothetical protein
MLYRLNEDSISSFHIVSSSLFTSFQSPEVVESPRTASAANTKHTIQKPKFTSHPLVLKVVFGSLHAAFQFAAQTNRSVSEPIRLSILLPMPQDSSVFTHRLRPQHLLADYINVIYFRETG